MLPRGGGCDSQLARITMMDNGFQILDMELGYQQRYKTRGGGWFYVDIWSTPKILGKKVIWKFDKESFNKWRLELLDEGFIPQLDEDVLSILIGTKTKRVERNAMRTHIPAIKKNYDEESIVLDLMRQYKKTGGPIPIKEEKKRMKKSV